MRIIAGEKRGTRLLSLEGTETRPTLDRVKEGMFSAVQFSLPGANVLDLFAGSGQLGLEALSRGATRCVFIEQNKAAAAVVIENAKNAGLFEKSKVACMEATSYLHQANEMFDIVFLDPPFGSFEMENLLQKVAGVVAAGGCVLLEHEGKTEMPASIEGGLVLKKQYRYGTVQVSRFCKEADEE